MDWIVVCKLCEKFSKYILLQFQIYKIFLKGYFFGAPQYSLTAHIVFNLRVQNVAPKRAFSRPDFKAKFAKCSIRDVFETTNFFDTKIQQMFPVMKHIDWGSFYVG